MSPHWGLKNRTEDDGLVPAIAMMILATMVGFVPIPNDPDLWFHLADGQYILSHGEVPQSDPFSFTKQGELWVPHSWLFDVGVTLVWEKVSPRAAEAGMAVVFMLAIMLSFHLLRSRGVSSMMAVGLCSGLAIAVGNTRGIRPQVFSLLFCNVVIYMLVKHRYRPRWSMVGRLSLLFLVWAQFHSGCVVGLGVMMVWLGGLAIDSAFNRTMPQMKHELGILAAAVAASCLAILITPHALTHYQYVIHTFGIASLKATQEWQAPAAMSLEIPDVYMYVLLVGVMLLLGRRAYRIGFTELVLCLALMILGFSGIRHIPLAWIGAVPLAASALARRDVYRTASIGETLKPVWIAAVLAGIVITGFWRVPQTAEARYALTTPKHGVDALAELNEPLRVFTTYNTGSYVFFADPQHLKVFVDSRADVYGDPILRQAFRAMYAQEWEQVFEAWKIDAAVVNVNDPLANALNAHTHWTLVGQDPSTLTFLKADRVPMTAMNR